MVMGTWICRTCVAGLEEKSIGGPGPAAGTPCHACGDPIVGGRKSCAYVSELVAAVAHRRAEIRASATRPKET